MSYILCAAPGCDVELRQNDAYACEYCWREGMGKTPRVEWRRVSEKVDGIPPSKKCDYCKHRNFKWHATSTVCSSCYFKENCNFKEDVTNTLSFLREFHPAPKSKEFTGDITLLVARDESPHRSGDDAHHSTNLNHAEHPSGSTHDAGNHEKVHASGDHEKHHDRPWAMTQELAKRQPLKIHAHRFILASKSTVFRKMFEKADKDRIDEERNEKLRQMMESIADDDEGHSGDKKHRQHHKKHGDHNAHEHDHKKHGEHAHHEPHEAAGAKEKKEPGVFHIDGVSFSVLKEAVNFMYTADIHFSEKVKPLDMLRFGHEYNVPWLKRVCESEMAKSITAKNLSEILRLSYRWEAEHLKKAARKFFEDHPESHNDVLDALLASGTES